MTMIAQMEAQRATFEGAQKQMTKIMVIMQSLGQAPSVPVQFSTPPPPTPITTSVSMKFRFSLVLCIYVAIRVVGDVGVHAIVDVGLPSLVSCRF